MGTEPHYPAANRGKSYWGQVVQVWGAAGQCAEGKGRTGLQEGRSSPGRNWQQCSPPHPQTSMLGLEAWKIGRDWSSPTAFLGGGGQKFPSPKETLVAPWLPGEAVVPILAPCSYRSQAAPDWALAAADFLKNDKWNAFYPEMQKDPSSPGKFSVPISTNLVLLRVHRCNYAFLGLWSCYRCKSLFSNLVFYVLFWKGTCFSYLVCRNNFWVLIFNTLSKYIQWDLHIHGVLESWADPIIHRRSSPQMSCWYGVNGVHCCKIHILPEFVLIA